MSLAVFIAQLLPHLVHLGQHLHDHSPSFACQPSQYVCILTTQASALLLLLLLLHTTSFLFLGSLIPTKT
jgi:hypothetical protein